jgi:organic radical activating enzyme
MRHLDLKIANRWDDIQKIREGLFPFPKSLTMFVSEVCNLKCPGCNSTKTHKNNGFMDLELFKKIVDDFYYHGGRAVAFEGGGEPMLHPQIDKMIYHLCSKPLQIGIITNGTIYKREMLYADWVRVSIPNPNKIPNIVRRNIGKLMANREITKIGVKGLRSKFCPDPNWLMLNTEVDYYQIKNLRNSKFSLVTNPDYIKPCVVTALRAVVDYNGSFYVCPFFPTLGKNTTIGKGLLSEIWGKEKHKQAIKNIKNCNKYDCPMSEIDWELLKDADLEFI